MDNKFIFGMNLHNKRYPSYPHGQLERNLEYCRELGIKLIRMNFIPLTEEDYEYINSVIDMCREFGMEFMLCCDKKIWKSEETEEDYYSYYKNLAERLKGRVEYYQVFNELDVGAMKLDIGGIYNAGDGKVKEQYNPARMVKVVPAVRGALRGVKEADPEAKTCINFCWWHTYFLELLDENGCEWDITGCDWYDDMQRASSFYELQGWLLNRFPGRPMIICETNWWMYSEPHEKEAREAAQAEWSRSFTEELYKNNRENSLKGIIYYELMDEPWLSPNSDKYCPEVHFGFVECNTEGDEPRKKPAFYELKEVISDLSD